MTKALVALALLGSAVSAHAEEFKCSFTEPFFSMTYSTDSRELVMKDDVMKKATITKNVAFKIAEGGKFLLNNSQGVSIAEIVVDREGSDGMSDIVYPFTIRLLKSNSGANGGVGGCESSLLKSVNPNHN